jgi:hypothetical protein
MTPEVSDFIRALKIAWLDAGVSLRTGVTTASLRAFESRNGVQLPTAFAAYLMEVDGMNDAEMDRDAIRFWPLDEIEPADRILADERLSGQFVFADYSLWAHGYAIDLSAKRGPVSIVGGAEPLPIAESFDAFLGAYVCRSEVIFGN